MKVLRGSHLPPVWTGDCCRTGTLHRRRSARRPDTCCPPPAQDIDEVTAALRTRVCWTHLGQELGLLGLLHITFHLGILKKDSPL